ncbi:uncharacterized protein [Panulirus ornatus]|uniref:uncharacterized protein n=1 Tax=Panulirus ornatus TaxID=150431 RepID=UPI003A86C9AC
MTLIRTRTDDQRWTRLGWGGAVATSTASCWRYNHPCISTSHHHASTVHTVHFCHQPAVLRSTLLLRSPHASCCLAKMKFSVAALLLVVMLATTNAASLTGEEAKVEKVEEQHVVKTRAAGDEPESVQLEVDDDDELEDEEDDEDDHNVWLRDEGLEDDDDDDDDDTFEDEEFEDSDPRYSEDDDDDDDDFEEEGEMEEEK